MGGKGLEPPTITPCKNNTLRQPGAASGAESGAVGAENASLAHELTVVIEAWPELPQAVRAGIVAMVIAAQRDGNNQERN